MTKNIKIRKFTNEDASAVAEMHRRTIIRVNSKDYNHKKIELWSARGGNPERHKLRLIQELKLVALDGSRIVGFADYDKESVLGGLYVDADYQGQGIGSVLLEAIEKDAIIKGYSYLTLESTITAKSFYEKHGFLLVEQSIHKIGSSEETLIVFIMRKDLKNVRS